MATKTLRPFQDSGARGHECSSGSSAYLLIDDATADNDSTYIYQTISSTSSQSKSTTVVLDSLFDSANYNVMACRLYFVARRTASNTSSASVTFKVNGSGSYAASASSLTNSYASYNATNTNLVSAINQLLRAGSVPEITATITTSGAMSSSKDSSSAVRITQVYLEVDYEDYGQPSKSIYVKQAGGWREYTQAYKKINGQWVAQSDLGAVFDEDINYIKGN